MHAYSCMKTNIHKNSLMYSNYIRVCAVCVCETACVSVRKPHDCPLPRDPQRDLQEQIMKRDEAGLSKLIRPWNVDKLVELRVLSAPDNRLICEKLKKTPKTLKFCFKASCKRAGIKGEAQVSACARVWPVRNSEESMFGVKIITFHFYSKKKMCKKFFFVPAL